ncbi:50S ribosomal protein L6, partial [Geodia barretti]
MSRVGKRPIPIPAGVTVQISPEAVEAKGPKGTMRQPLPPGIVVEMQDGVLHARPEREERALAKFHGLGRSLVANAVTGVSAGFKKELDIVGIGYRAEVTGQRLTLALGYSHPVIFEVPAGIAGRGGESDPSGGVRGRPPGGGADRRGHSQPPQAGSVQAEGDPVYRR